MRRFSVRNLMVLIIGAAVGLAALRNANVYWASAIAVVVGVTVAVSVIAALALRGRERYGWAGFAVFSVAYLGVTIGTVLSDPFKDPFGTNKLLNYVSQVAGYESTPGSLQAVRAMVVEQMKSETSQSGRDAFKIQLEQLDDEIADDQAQRNSAARWRSWLPGAINGDDFVRVGQSLFALLSGWVGSVVGRMFYARRKRSETQTP
jgi:hypothetical protein